MEELTKIHWFLYGIILGVFARPAWIVVSKFWAEAKLASKEWKDHGKPK